MGVLGYDVPEQLAAALRKLAPAAQYDALDAGCGTGLCGPLLRPLCRTLSGVDLSAGMLARAERRGVYDALVCEELVGFLARHPGQFDLLVAADVLLYFGNLAPLFAAAATALRAGGLFGLSIERDLVEGPSPGYRVLPAGRFAHAPDYLRAVAVAAFDQELCLDTTLRLEAQRRVRGICFSSDAAPDRQCARQLLPAPRTIRNLANADEEKPAQHLADSARQELQARHARA